MPASVNVLEIFSSAPTHTASTGLAETVCLRRSASTTRVTAVAMASEIGNRGLHIHDKDGVTLVILQQNLERRDITRRICITNNIDRIGARPCRRQNGVELLFDDRIECRQNTSQFDKSVYGEDANAAPIGENGQPLSKRRI